MLVLFSVPEAYTPGSSWEMSSALTSCSLHIERGLRLRLQLSTLHQIHHLVSWSPPLPHLSLSRSRSGPQCLVSGDHLSQFCCSFSLGASMSPKALSMSTGARGSSAGGTPLSSTAAAKGSSPQPPTRTGTHTLCMNCQVLLTLRGRFWLCLMRSMCFGSSVRIREVAIFKFKMYQGSLWIWQSLVLKATLSVFSAESFATGQLEIGSCPNSSGWTSVLPKCPSSRETRVPNYDLVCVSYSMFLTLPGVIYSSPGLTKLHFWGPREMQTLLQDPSKQ